MRRVFFLTALLSMPATATAQEAAPDVLDRIASAKLLASWGIDYFHREPPPAIWGELAPGPFRVGLEVVRYTDPSRPYAPLPGPDGEWTGCLRSCSSRPTT